MKKVLIIILILLIPAQTYTMFSFWFNNEPSIEKTKNLKQRAELLLAKNSSNLPLKIYLDSIANKDINRSNYSKISADLKTLLFPGNTHIFERVLVASSQNIAPASWLNLFSWTIFGSPQQRLFRAIYEIPEIVSDTSFSLRMSDALVGLVSMVIADKFVRNNGNNSLSPTLLLAPLYVGIPIAVLCLKKCRFDMNLILRKNNEYLVELDAQKTRESLTQVENLQHQNQNLHQNVQLLTARQIEQAAQAQERLEEEKKKRAQLIITKFIKNIQLSKSAAEINRLKNQVNNLNQTNQALCIENNQLRNQTNNSSVFNEIDSQGREKKNINLKSGVNLSYLFKKDIGNEVDNKSKCFSTTSNNAGSSTNLQNSCFNNNYRQNSSCLNKSNNIFNSSQGDQQLSQLLQLNNNGLYLGYVNFSTKSVLTILNNLRKVTK